MDLKLTSDGDVDLSGNDFTLLDGNDAIGQHVLIRLQMFVGDWFLDQRVGVPYYTKILIKNPNENVVRNLFRSVVSGTPGIESITSFSLEYENATRTLGVTFTATTTSSDEPLEFTEELIL